LVGNSHGTIQGISLEEQGEGQQPKLEPGTSEMRIRPLCLGKKMEERTELVDTKPRTNTEN